MAKFFTLLFLLMSFQLHALVEKTIHIEGHNSKATWMDYTSSEELNLKRLMDLLARSPVGEKLIKEARYKASRSGQTLADVVKVGDSSLTDTTLVRKFNPQSPENVVYETKSVVYLNRHLAFDDALLDLAHELTHFVYRESFNPYDSSFNAREFVRGTIEGSGGEVQAFLTECKVLRELFSRQVHSRSHCQKIEDDRGQLSYTKAVELFYHIGPYYEAFHKQLVGRKLDSSFSDLKGEKINFISSAYGVPYPVAALMEYDLVMNKVCENDKKRLAYMQQEPVRNVASVGRRPSSINESSEKFAQSYSVRCSGK